MGSGASSVRAAFIYGSRGFHFLLCELCVMYCDILSRISIDRTTYVGSGYFAQGFMVAL